MSRKTSIKKDKTAAFAEIFYGIMLALITGVMPLILHLTIRSVPVDLRHITTGRDPDMPNIYVDFFVYGKSLVLVGAAIAMVFHCLATWLTGAQVLKFKPYLKRVPVILSLVYLAFVFISAIASSYNQTAWFGTIYREEGALMWLIYVVVFVAAMLYVREPKHTKPILWGLAFSSILMGIVGFSQLIGRDILETNIMIAIMTWGIEVQDFATVFDIAHGTLFNPNTFGKYTAMVAPILLICGFVYDGKIYVKIAMLIGGALMLIGIFASGSLGGLIGIITATAAVVGTYVCGLFYRKKQNAIRAGLAFGGVAVIISLAILFVPPLNHRFTTLINRLQEAAAAETTANIRFSFYGNNIYIYRGQGQLLNLTVNSWEEEGWMTVRDGTGAELAPLNITDLPQQESTLYEFAIPGSEGLTVIRTPDFFLVNTTAQNNPFFLRYDNNRLYGLSRLGTATTNLSEPVSAWGFEGRETWGSGRGFIWSRSFPLMPSRILIGSGPDTYVNIFPHHDFSGLHLTFGDPYHLVDKAHNIFLQTWITTGGISAIALFGLFFFYIFTTFISLVKSRGETVYCYGLRLGLLAGISGFVMAGMATDSTVGSTGVFFVLLGMGYGINYFIKQKNQSDI